MPERDGLAGAGLGAGRRRAHLPAPPRGVRQRGPGPRSPRAMGRFAHRPPTRCRRTPPATGGRGRDRGRRRSTRLGNDGPGRARRLGDHPARSRLSRSIRRPAGAAAGDLRMGRAIRALDAPRRRRRRHPPTDRRRPPPRGPAGAPPRRAGDDRHLGPRVRHRRRCPRSDGRGRGTDDRCHRGRARGARAARPSRTRVLRSSPRAARSSARSRHRCRPEKGSFPRRNRLIAALADADDRRRGAGQERRAQHGPSRPGAGPPTVRRTRSAGRSERGRLPAPAARDARATSRR